MAQSPFFKNKPARKKDIPRVEMEIRYSCDPLDYEVTVSGTGDEQTISWWDHGLHEELRGVSPDDERVAWSATKTLLAADPWAIRSAFEAVGTPQDALKFLRLSGPFRPDINGNLSQSGSVTWKAFVDWQAYFANQSLKMKLFGPLPETGGLNPTTLEHLRGSPKVNFYPVMHRNRLEFLTWIGCASVIETVAATILVDKLQGIKDERCAWSECGKIFQKTNPLKNTCDRRCARGHWREQNPKSKRKAAFKKAGV